MRVPMDLSSIYNLGCPIGCWKKPSSRLNLTTYLDYKLGPSNPVKDFFDLGAGLVTNHLSLLWLYLFCFRFDLIWFGANGTLMSWSLTVLGVFVRRSESFASFGFGSREDFPPSLVYLLIGEDAENPLRVFVSFSFLFFFLFYSRRLSLSMPTSLRSERLGFFPSWSWKMVTFFPLFFFLLFPSLFLSLCPSSWSKRREKRVWLSPSFPSRFFFFFFWSEEAGPP